jgi:hypothetical protein
MADHHRGLAIRQAKGARGAIGVAVVPLNKMARRVYALQILTGQPQGAVGVCSIGQHHRRVVGAQVVECDGRRAALWRAANANVGQQRAARIGCNLTEALGDVLHVLVVGRNAVPHQAEWHRQPLIDVDLHIWVAL